MMLCLISFLPAATTIGIFGSSVLKALWQTNTIRGSSDHSCHCLVWPAVPDGNGSLPLRGVWERWVSPGLPFIHCLALGMRNLRDTSLYHHCWEFFCGMESRCIRLSHSGKSMFWSVESRGYLTMQGHGNSGRTYGR